MTKTKKIISWAIKISWWVVFALLFLLCLTVISAKLKGEVPRVFGYSVIKVATPSMEETIPTNTYILIKKTQPKNVNEEDIICFYSDDPKIYGYPNTHRVIGVNFENGKYEFVTKGDANGMQDSVTAKGDKLIGKYVKTLKGVTWISNTINSMDMIVVFIVMFVCSLGIIIATSVIKLKKETNESKKE